MSLLSLKFRRIGRRLHADGPRIVHLLAQDTRTVLLRKPRSVVLHRNLHVIGRFFGRQAHPPPFLRVLAGILYQRIDHEESQSLVGLHASRGLAHRERLFLQLKRTVSLGEDGKQLLQVEILDVKAQRALPHLDPQSQYVVVFIDFCHQFVDVHQFAAAHRLLTVRWQNLKLAYLVHHSVDIGHNPRHDRQARLLHLVLALVLHEMLFVDILFLLQPLLLLIERYQVHAMLQCPGQVRQQQPDESLLLLANRSRQPQPQPSHRDRLARRLELEYLRNPFTRNRRSVLRLSFLTESDAHIAHSKQCLQFRFHDLDHRIGHFLPACSRCRHRPRHLLTESQHALQFREIHGVLFPPRTVQPDKQDHQHQKACGHQPQEHIQLARLLFQRRITALQFLVLPCIIQNIQVHVAVVVRLRLAAHGRIRAAQLFPQAGNPFGYGMNTLVVNPLQFDGSRSPRLIRLQPVERIRAMIIFLVMQVDIVQRLLQVDQRLFRLSAIIVESGQRAIRPRNLVPVAVTLEQSQRLPGKHQWQTVHRQALRIDQPQQPRPLLAQQFPVAAEHQQFRHGL